MAFRPLEQILAMRAPGERLALLIRHAERRHILPTDADYGALVPITELGKAQAMNFGKVLRGGTLVKGGLRTAHYFSSPVMRCRETASTIAGARGDAAYDSPEKVEALGELGDFYVADYPEYERLLQRGFYEAIIEFLQRGSMPGFAPLAETSEKFLNRILSASDSDLNLFVTHDAWIVPFLSHFTDIPFRPDLWLNFLSGAAIFFGKGAPRVEGVAGLGDGYLRFT